MTLPAQIADATRRSGVVWVRPHHEEREHLLWHLWHRDHMYVVTGGLEQPLPPCERAVVSVRSRDRQGDLLARWAADVEPVEPRTAVWDEVVPLLHAKRLNAPDGEEQPNRWAAESTVLRFTPTGELLPVAPG